MFLRRSRPSFWTLRTQLATVRTSHLMLRAKGCMSWRFEDLMACLSRSAQAHTLHFLVGSLSSLEWFLIAKERGQLVSPLGVVSFQWQQQIFAVPTTRQCQRLPRSMEVCWVQHRNFAWATPHPHNILQRWMTVSHWLCNALKSGQDRCNILDITVARAYKFLPAPLYTISI